MATRGELVSTHTCQRNQGSKIGYTSATARECNITSGRHCITDGTRSIDIYVLVIVIAWVAVKFGINTTSVVLEIYHFQYNKSGIYPKFHCYPFYSQLILYSLHIRTHAVH